MSDLVDIKDFKTKRSIKKLLVDIEVIIKVMNLSIRGLTPFSKFINVAEAISSLKTNKTLREISYNKYKKKLDEQKN